VLQRNSIVGPIKLSVKEEHEMASIKIEDLPMETNLDTEQLETIFGGYRIWSTSSLGSSSFLSRSLLRPTSNPLSFRQFSYQPFKGLFQSEEEEEPVQL
jgi:hypothetical protein